MSRYSIEPLRLDGLRTYPLAKRKSKVTVRDFARAVPPAKRRRGRATISDWLDSLPRILAGAEFRELLAALVRARRQRRPILWGIGGHVIKTGLAPVLIDLLQRRYISGIAMNGAALVHDFEIALAAATSEDVPETLGRGQFGMAHETGLYLNECAVGAARSRIGLGEAAGKFLTSGHLKTKAPESSLLVAAYRARVPVTVHLAIGTDIPHMHPSADGAALGAATHYDFRLFCALVKRMAPGGIYLNWGSAVVLPEIFLKAISVAANLGGRIERITTANFDFLPHYRPLQNVVKRPTMGRGSHGFHFAGHHELMMPLLSAALP